MQPAPPRSTHMHACIIYKHTHIFTFTYTHIHKTKPTSRYASYMCRNINAYTSLYTYVCIHTCAPCNTWALPYAIHTYIYAHTINIPTHIDTHLYLIQHVHILLVIIQLSIYHVSVRTPRLLCTRVHLQACVYVCMYACVYTHTHVCGSSIMSAYTHA